MSVVDDYFPSNEKRWPIPVTFPGDPDWVTPTKHDKLHLQIMGFRIIFEMLYSDISIKEKLQKAVKSYSDWRNRNGTVCQCRPEVDVNHKPGDDGETSFFTSTYVQVNPECMSNCTFNWYRPKNFPKTGYASDTADHHLIAKEKIRKGLPVTEYFGVVTQGQLQNNQTHALPITTFKNLSLYVDSELFGSRARMIGHSLTPNCKVQEWVMFGRLHLIIVALEDIEVLTPITIKYPQMKTETGNNSLEWENHISHHDEVTLIVEDVHDPM